LLVDAVSKIKVAAALLGNFELKFDNWLQHPQIYCPHILGLLWAKFGLLLRKQCTEKSTD
jgi:hypothetical protein